MLFSLLAVLWTWPLARHFSTSIPGTPGDNLAFLWNDWSMRVSLASGTSPFFSRDIFAPFGIDLTLHTHTALTSWLSATLLGGLPIIAAHNVLLLLALALNGFSAYLLAWDRLGRRDLASHDGARWAGAIVAGLIFAGAPYLAAHLLGHVNLVSAWGIPLFVFAFLRMLERRSHIAAMCAAAVGVVTAYNDYYYLVYLGVAAAVILTQRARVGEWVASRQRPWLRRATMVLLAIDVAGVAVILASGGFVATVLGMRIVANRPTNLLAFAWLLSTALFLQWRHPKFSRRSQPDGATLPLSLFAVLGGGLAAGLAPLVWRAIGLIRAGAYVAPDTSWRSSPAGVDLLTLFVGHPWHSWMGPPVRRLYDAMAINTVEQVGWMGVLPVMLAITAMYRFRRDDELRLWRWLGVVFFVWALGPWLKIGGVDTGLLLPQNVVAHLPIVGNARMPGRAMVVVFLAVALGAAFVIGRRRVHAMRWAAAAAVVIVLEFLPAPFPLTPIATPAMYEALRDLPAGSVCELPLGLRDGFSSRGGLDERVLVYQMTHRHPLVGGFAARVPESVREGYNHLPVVRSLLLLSEGASADAADLAQPRETAREALVNVDIKYVVLDRAQALPALVDYVERQLPLRSVLREGDRELFEVVSPDLAAPARP